MAHVLRTLTVVAALALLAVGCGDDGDADPVAIDDAGPGDITDAGEQGAFGDVTECDVLVEEAVSAHRAVVDALGDAGRGDVDRIDAALEAFGAGPDLQVRVDALDCTREEFGADVCAAMGDVVGAGPAAEDYLAGVTRACDGDGA